MSAEKNLLLLFRYIQEEENMKPLLAQLVPGKTETERFDNAVRKAFSRTARRRGAL